MSSFVTDISLKPPRIFFAFMMCLVTISYRNVLNSFSPRTSCISYLVRI